ncbi:hypothetical protein JL720_7739 [Aureococcus anophagefferens]|nr:hypothetical protein JL720_7739 [Aureococcus anophagefferens]
MLARRLVQGALLLVLSIAKTPPPPSPLYVHSVLHPPPAFGDGCDETLDFRFVAADAAALRARAAALAEAAAAAAAAVERETREREAALVAARLASALGEYAIEAFATDAADDARPPTRRRATWPARRPCSGPTAARRSRRSSTARRT